VRTAVCDRAMWW